MLVSAAMALKARLFKAEIGFDKMNEMNEIP